MENKKKIVKKIATEGERAQLYSPILAFEKVKEYASAKFDESLTVSVVLGINAEKSDQHVRGSVILPVKFGKPPKIVAFAKGEQAEVAKKSGADVVGAEELIEKVLTENWTDFDFSVTTPDLMSAVGKTAKILGPLGLLPSKKNNTVGLDLGEIIKELKSGLLFFKNDKSGQINFTFGKVKLSSVELEENFNAFLSSLKQSKPSTVKSNFIKKITVSSTMGPGFKIQCGIV